MNVFGKPNEQNQACLSFAMAGKGRKKSNVFGKPNEQNQACLSFAMAGKGRKKSNELAEENNEAAPLESLL